MTLYTTPPATSVVVCLDEMGPESAKSFPGMRLVQTKPIGHGWPASIWLRIRSHSGRVRFLRPLAAPPSLSGS